MKILKYLLPLLALPFLFSSGCKKEKQEPPLIKLDPEFMEWAYYKTGTWWLYENKDKGNDSVFVTFDTIGIGEADEEVFRRIEGFSFKTKSYRTGRVVSHGGSSVCMGNTTSNTVCFLAIYELFPPAEGHTYYLFYPLVIGTQKKPNGFSVVTLEKILDSMESGATTFRNVAVMHETRNFQEGGYETRLYLAKNYGIIRKEINATTTGADNWQRWDLVRWNIVQ